MRRTIPAIALTPGLALGLALGLAGCSGDNSNDPTGPGASEDPVYAIEVYIGDAIVPGGGVSAVVVRLRPEDPSAKEVAITVNGAPVPLLSPVSTDEDALFATTAVTYEDGATYTVAASYSGRHAICTFTAPPYVWPEITAPADGSGLSPGDPIALTWNYAGGIAEDVFVGVMGDGDEMLYEAALEGATTSHTVPGSATSDWGGQSELLVTVDCGEIVWPITGELAAPGSFAGTVLPGDAILLDPDGGTSPQWTVQVWSERSGLEADGTSSTTVWADVLDAFGAPAPDGTVVTFSVEPEGLGTVDPASAITEDGAASTVYRSGTAPGQAQIRASALGATGSAAVSLAQPLQVEVGTGSHPVIAWAPTQGMYGIVVRQDGMQSGNLRWSVITTSVTGFLPPVTYGTAPAQAQQLYPFTGAAQPLTPGVGYRLGLVNAAGDTTFVRFTP